MIRSILRFLCWTTPVLLWDGIRLFGLVVCCSPGFARFSWYYWVASNRTSIRFGKDSCRQTLDVYSLAVAAADVEDNDESSARLLGAPVVVFFTGGAWLIGYKMWGTLLARALTAAGIVVVIPDMRNYPWASVPAMVEDVEISIAWTLKHIADYGGDPEKIVIVGQSAGGHVACTALLRRALLLQRSRSIVALEGFECPSDDEENDDQNDYEEEMTNWRPTDLRGFISLSAPYNLALMQQSFSRHGLDPHLVDRIFGGDKDSFEPYRIVLNCQSDGIMLNDYLPPIQIYHGSIDKTVPHEGSSDFHRELQKVLTEEHPVTFTLYDGWSHTDPILEGPMDADHRFHRDLFQAVKVWTNASNLVWPENDPLIRRRLCPHFLVQLGRFWNPF
jgi:prenylcysteine alpha-carboxyl methylesterase